MKKISVILMLFLLITVSAQAVITDPGDISGLYVRLEADSLGLEHGDTVTSWTDAANSYNFTGTATYDAYFANGHAAVYFDGIADQLKNQGWTDGPSPADATLFVVGNFTTTGNDENSDWMISAQWPEGTTANRFRLIKYKNDGRYQFRVGSASTVTLNTTTDTEKHVFALVSGQTAGAVDLLVDGELFGSGSSGSVVDMQALGLGSNHRGGDLGTGNQFADCTIAEVLLYDHALTAQEVTDVTDYLQAKYADMTVTQTDVLTGVDATLEWSALAEPGNYSQVNSDLIKQYVYMSEDQNVSNDPNLYYHGESAVVSGLTSDYTAGLGYDGSYDAAVVFVMNGYDYTPTAGVSKVTDIDPNNILGPEVSFETLAQLAQITQQPVSIKVDAGQNTSFIVEFSSTQMVTAAWTKDGQPVTAGVVTDTDSSTLTIIGAASTDEGDYVCTLTNIGGEVVSDTAALRLKKLLAWYEFEQNADDSAGTNNGTAVPGMDYSTGLVGSYAVDPNGANYIELSTDAYPKAGFGNGLDSFTYSAWVKRGTYSGDARIFGAFNDGSTTAVQFGVAGDGTIGCYLREADSTGTTLNTDPGLVGTDEWYHIVGTFNGSRMRIYLNGLMVAEVLDDSLATFGDWQYPMVLCGRNDRGTVNQFFPGEIDDLRMYNYVLTDEAIAQLYYDISEKAVCLYGYPEFDFSGPNGEQDCKVDLWDMTAFATQWLDCGLYPDCQE